MSDIHTRLCENIRSEAAPYGLVRPCLIWTGAWRGDSGYGQISIDGSPENVHRVAYRTWVGPIPDGEQVQHRCDRKLCIEPTHFQTGGQAQNIQDAVARGRMTGPRNPHKAQGTRNANAKLTDAQALKIRDDPRPQAVIAAENGVTQGTVSGIQSGRRWKHLP